MPLMYPDEPVRDEELTRRLQDVLVAFWRLGSHLFGAPGQRGMCRRKDSASPRRRPRHRRR